MKKQYWVYEKSEPSEGFILKCRPRILESALLSLAEEYYDLDPDLQTDFVDKKTGLYTLHGSEKYSVFGVAVFCVEITKQNTVEI